MSFRFPVRRGPGLAVLAVLPASAEVGVGDPVLGRGLQGAGAPETGPEADPDAGRPRK